MDKYKIISLYLLYTWVLTDKVITLECTVYNADRHNSLDNCSMKEGQGQEELYTSKVLTFYMRKYNIDSKQTLKS